MSVGMTMRPNSQEMPALSGAGLLDLVTVGMYDDPLSMYREYIQNAADAVGLCESAEKVQVEVSVDVTGRQIRVRDNGPGLSRDEALERLLPIGRSEKTLGTDRGFRGVGRLAGLAFAKTVAFTTRAGANQPVTRITWHSDNLPERTSTDAELDQAILRCVDVETLPDADFPDHFFDVQVGGVARHSAGLLLDRDAVRHYLGEVCPVPMSREFRFAGCIDGLFDSNNAPLTLDVTLEGDPTPVERPYGKSIRFSTTKEAEFLDFEEVRLRSVDGDGDAAVGWVAHSTYMGAIPKDLRVRGIRARVGNIQVGGEGVFDHLFAEERFNRWCVGEIHILDSRIVPNSRRDYFQPGPHLRNLENQLNPVLRRISARCRRESTARNRLKKSMSSLGNVEDLYALAASGYLAAGDSTKLVQEALQEVEELRQNFGKGTPKDGAIERVDEVEDKLNRFSVDSRSSQFEDLTPTEVAIYQRVFGALTTLSPSPGSARKLIEMVLAEASVSNETGLTGVPDPQNGDRPQTRMKLGDVGALTPA